MGGAGLPLIGCIARNDNNYAAKKAPLDLCTIVQLRVSAQK